MEIATFMACQLHIGVSQQLIYHSNDARPCVLILPSSLLQEPILPGKTAAHLCVLLFQVTS